MSLTKLPLSNKLIVGVTLIVGIIFVAPRIRPGKSVVGLKSSLSRSGNVCPWNERPLASDVTTPRVYNDSITLWGLPRSYLPYTREGVSQLLPEFRNPCWYRRQDESLYCLPYFYLLGVSKSGTTEFFSTLARHPDVVTPSEKELGFWNHLEDRDTLQNYLLNFKEATREILSSSTAAGCHNKVTFEATPQYFANQRHLDQFSVNSPGGASVEPLYTLAHTLYTVNPQTRLIVILRNPTSRLFSHYHCLEKNKADFSPENFHELVEAGVALMRDCLSSRSQRSCAFDGRHLGAVSHGYKLMLHFSMYSVYAREWLSVFPREQMLFVKAEDFYENPSEVLKEAYRFLEIGDAPDSLYEELDMRAKNYQTSHQQKTSYRELMWNKTRALLDEYFEPFNQDLAALLGDDKWLFGAKPADT